MDKIKLTQYSHGARCGCKILKLVMLDFYVSERFIPVGIKRNWDSYGENIQIEEQMKSVLCDPQTSGGLLIAVEEGSKIEVEYLLKELNMPAISFGCLIGKEERWIRVS